MSEKMPDLSETLPKPDDKNAKLADAAVRKSLEANILGPTIKKETPEEEEEMTDLGPNRKRRFGITTEALDDLKKKYKEAERKAEPEETGKSYL